MAPEEAEHPADLLLALACTQIVDDTDSQIESDLIRERMRELGSRVSGSRVQFRAGTVPEEART